MPYPHRLRQLTGLTALLSAAVCLLSACQKHEWTGDVTLNFTFSYGGQQLDALDGARLFEMPVDANQHITIEEIRYFVSKVYLIEEGGARVALTEADGNGCHYIDGAMPATRSWTVKDVPCGHYTGIGFTYGLDETDNVSHRFVNPPESLMYWPEALGGGYHYMQINGKWLPDAAAEHIPYGLHTGIGQTWNGDVPTAFHQNYVRFEFADTASLFLTMENNVSLTVDMDVRQWLTDPHPWDFATEGTAIMQNQDAQQILKENAWNVFSIH